MTRKHDPKLPLEGADDSPEVRALLTAGGTDQIDYDFERGLAAHLGAIGVVPGQGSGPSGGASAKTAASGLSPKAWLLLVGAPVAAVSAGVALSFGAWGGLGGPAAASLASVASVASVMVGAPVTAAPRAPGGSSTPSPLPAAGPAIPAREPSEAAAATSALGRGEGRASLAASTIRERQVAAVPAVGSEGTAHPAKPEAIRLAETLPDTESGNSAPRSTRDHVAQGVSSASSSVPAGTDPSVAARAAASAAEARADEADLEAAAQRRKASAEQAARVADQRLEREMAALAEAKHALSSDPARALSLARDGERDFPHGVFGEERRHILILALIRLGRLDEARRLAAPYLEQHPDSPFARRVRTALSTAGSQH